MMSEHFPWIQLNQPYAVAEVAVILGVSRTQVYTLLDTKAIRGHNMGTGSSRVSVRIFGRDVEAYLLDNTYESRL